MNGLIACAVGGAFLGAMFDNAAGGALIGVCIWIIGRWTDCVKGECDCDHNTEDVS
ncbi:MAG: hypothetical protein ACW99G_04825 [Candidatus Thorarchaeota archaeon]|jgi:hypothetical protein